MDLTRFSPLSTDDYFDTLRDIRTPTGTVRVYETNPNSTLAVVVLVHGGGHTGLTYALTAKKIREIDSLVGVLSYDLRGHGMCRDDDDDDDDVGFALLYFISSFASFVELSTGSRRGLSKLASSIRKPSKLISARFPGKTELLPKENLSLNTLTSDLVTLIESLYPSTKTAPPLVLIGHSLGGSIIANACPRIMEIGYKVLGVGVLDVVEGTAVESLAFMKGVLRKRPRRFGRIEEAIHWAYVLFMILL